MTPPLIKSVAMTVADCKYASLTLASTVKSVAMTVVTTVKSVAMTVATTVKSVAKTLNGYSQKCRKDSKLLQSKVSQ